MYSMIGSIKMILKKTKSTEKTENTLSSNESSDWISLRLRVSQKLGLNKFIQDLIKWNNAMFFFSLTKNCLRMLLELALFFDSV